MYAEHASQDEKRVKRAPFSALLLHEQRAVVQQGPPVEAVDHDGIFLLCMRMCCVGAHVDAFARVFGPRCDLIYDAPLPAT